MQGKMNMSRKGKKQKKKEKLMDFIKEEKTQFGREVSGKLRWNLYAP